MKIHVKKILVTATALAMLMSFTACGQKKEEVVVDPPFTALRHEIAVVHITVDLHPGIYSSESLMFKIREADAAASRRRETAPFRL